MATARISNITPQRGRAMPLDTEIEQAGKGAGGALGKLTGRGNSDNTPAAERASFNLAITVELVDEDTGQVITSGVVWISTGGLKHKSVTEQEQAVLDAVRAWAEQQQDVADETTPYLALIGEEIAIG